jgi:hypothetical protein
VYKDFNQRLCVFDFITAADEEQQVLPPEHMKQAQQYANEDYDYQRAILMLPVFSS